MTDKLSGDPARLLGSDEPPPFMVYRPEGRSACFLTCDHAGDLIPRKLGTLGLGPHDLVRHIAWDIGAAGLSRILSERLDATLVTQTYSRLVIDCNRATHRPDSIAKRSENSDVPGNQNVTPEEAETRAREIFWPYHAAIEQQLDARQAAGRPTILIAMHSFTPVYKGEQRPWHIGLLYNRDARLATILKDILDGEPGLCIGNNQPYHVHDDSDYGIPVHGERRGLPHIEIEMRHDLIETVENQRLWAERWAGWFARAQERLRELDGAI